MGHKEVDMSSVARPDAFERKNIQTDKAKLAQRNRRIFYWIMRGALCDEMSSLIVNPTEWWHWSYGDQMWAALTHVPTAVYGMPADE